MALREGAQQFGDSECWAAQISKTPLPYLVTYAKPMSLGVLSPKTPHPKTPVPSVVVVRWQDDRIIGCYLQKK